MIPQLLSWKKLFLYNLHKIPCFLVTYSKFCERIRAYQIIEFYLIAKSDPEVFKTKFPHHTFYTMFTSKAQKRYVKTKSGYKPSSSSSGAPCNGK